MHHMTRRLAVVFASLVTMAAVKPAAAIAKLNVVTTTPDLAAIARAITGDLAEVRSLGRPNEDPHFVEPRPSYVVVLNRADLLVETGMELETGWLPALVRQTRNAPIRAGAAGRVVAGAGIRALDIPAGRVDRSMGDVHPLGNPHYLMDPGRALTAAGNIARGLAAVAPAHQDRFAANLAAFEQATNRRLAEFQRQCSRCQGQKVVTFHASFSYFAERFGLKVINTIEPKPGIPPSPAHLARLIRQMKEESVRLVMTEPWHRRSVPRVLLQETGARLVVMPVHPAKRDGGDYLASIEAMVTAVAEAME